MNRTEYEQLKKQSNPYTSREDYENLKKNNTVNNDEKVTLALNDGLEFGTISGKAYRAISNGTLDFYKPIDAEEKKVIDKYKNYLIQTAAKQVASESASENTSAEQKAYIKYAVNKATDIEGVNNEQKLLGGDTTQYKQAPEKSFLDKAVDGVKDFFDNAITGTNIGKWINESNDFKDNKAAWTDDQLAKLAINALHNSDNADTTAYGIVDEAYARLSRSSKYKDSDLVLALKEAKKSWGASPLTATGKNIKAAVYGMAGNMASFTDSIGADKIPGLNSLNDAVIAESKKAQEEAANYNKGYYGEGLGTFTQGVVNLLPYYFLGSGSVATNTLSKAPKYATYIKTIAKNPSFWYSLSTMWGQKYQEALDGGATETDALKNAILYSVPAALVEVSGGVGSAKGTEKISTTIIEEIGEEIAQDIINGAADKATTNPNLPVFSMTENAVINPVNLAKTAVMTAPIVAVAGGANVGINKIANLTNQRIQMRKITNEKKVIDSVTKFTNDAYSKMFSDDVDISKLILSNSELKKIGELYSEETTFKALIQEGLESPSGTVSRTLAEELDNKVKTKEEISNKEIGKLVVENIKQIVSEQVTEEKTKSNTKETNIEENNEQSNVPYNVLANPEILVGDKFKDTKTGNPFTVVNRDDTKTTVEIETPKGTVTREFSNERADNIIESGQVEKIMSAESEAVELMNTDMSEDVEPVAEVGTSTDTTIEKNSAVENTVVAETPMETSTNEDNGAVAKNAITTTEEKATKQKPKIVRAKKSDWASHDVIWTAPNSKTVIAYSTVAASDLIGTMADDNPKMTISELHDAINYDAEAKKVLQKYIDSGFGDDIASKFFTYGKNTVKSANTETPSTEEVLQNQPESDTMKEKTGTEIEENGIDEGRSLFEKYEQRSELQKTGKQVEKIQDTVSGRSDFELSGTSVYKRGFDDTSRRIKQTEARKLEELLNNRKFKTLKNKVNENMSTKLLMALLNETYANENQLLEEGYDFADVFTYDLISGKEKELSALFYDEISEYFNQNNSTDVDSAGMTIHQNVLKRLKDSIVRNDEGQLIPVYHSTKFDFKKFEIGDIGFHFGNYIQAYQRAIDEKYLDEAIFIKAYLDIKNPLIFDVDSMGWNAGQIFPLLAEKGILSAEKAIEYIHSKLSHKEMNDIVRKLIQDKGYDGIIYKNDHESGYADSYIVFDDSQIIRINDTNPTNKENEKDVHERVLDRESGNDNAVRESEPVSKVEEERNSGTEDRELGEDVSSENGTDIQTAETKPSATGQHNSGDRNNGIRESDNGNGDSGIRTDGNDNVNNEVTDDTENVKENKAKDYSITKAVAEELDTKSPNIDDNIKAIETLHELENSKKSPTKTQQSILAKFKGWGGLSNAFWSARNRLKEIMSDSEISAAQSTVNDAYFTPTTIIDSIYKGLNHLGFEGGNILEPSMGVGNFFGKMPKAIKDVSSLFGVEIDTISGKIAQYLYPSANIEVAPFQDVAYKDNSFDLIIGNVPFGEVKYKYKNNKYLIHDYFFVKAMDKLNDGGVMVFLTSKGTLDKLDSTTRAELNRQGNIIGAYRLPSNVFTRSAGANVVTDLIIMQKTANNNGEKFVNTGNVKIGTENFSINEYFVNHPENIIGELTYRRGQYGKYELTVQSTGDVAEQLTKAIRKLPKNLLSGVQTVGTTSVMETSSPLQTFYINDKGNVEYVDAQSGEVKELKNTVKNKNNDIAKDYIAIKKAYTELTDYTLNDVDTSTIESKRKELNNLYDGFVKKHGTFEKNKKLLSADNDFYKLSGLEVYDTKTKKIIKSEMFVKDTIGKRKPKKADNPLDALSISMGESGTVNLKRISELTNLSVKEVVEQLSDRIIYTPDGTYELNEVYLSGNVREKYEAVKGKKGFEKNEQMLKAVIPEDIPAKDITPQLGSPWIEPKYVADFLKETLHIYGTPKVSYDITSGTWSISGDTWGDNTLMRNKYGTNHIDAVSLAEKALNMRRIVVRNKDGIVMVGETRAAQQKADDIRTAFEEWCFKDADRRNALVETFNKKFNSNRNMDFSELAKYLTFNGLSETFKLRDYQKRAVARAVFNGNTLLAHGVGTGKTAEMITIAMELKRMGMAKKNMMVVPPHKVADFRNDILKMYPTAKVIMLEKGANPTQRQKFYAQVAANDFDIVIIPHTAFGMLDVSDDTKKSFINNQIAELEEVLTAAQLERGKIDGRFIRQLENQKKRLEEKLKQVTESKKDNGNTFEELGVDSLFVDEAHNFKNLPFYTKLSRVAGVSINQSNNKTRASRAENMFMITDYLNKNNGRITFGTATPITNSMSEIYNMTRFLRPDILRDAGIQSFDAWASMYGSIVNQAEVDPSGRNMRMKERFSKFKNVSQMIEQFRRMADILKTGDVIQDLPVAERIDVINPPNAIQEEFLDIIDEIVDDIRTNGQRAEHNMLEVTTAGQMAAIDLRFVESYFEGKYTLDDLNIANNRTSQVAQRVYDEYVKSNANKGTQFIFCDKGVSDDPSKKYNFYVYGDLINKLVASGIPRNEIAIAQDFEDKADLSAKVNTGEIRVLIGSTAVMGEGMNAQQKAVALHHMTVPDRPSDIEQREGRIIRFGNENKNVRIYRYIQEKSYDSYQWQMQERKANFINQALSGGTVEELEEMSDFQLSAREAKAIASGNPLLLEKIEVEDKLSKLKSIRKKFNTDKLEMQERLAVLPNRIRAKEKLIADTKADMKTIEANKTKDFEITLGKTKYTERAKAAEALERVLNKVPKNGNIAAIGSYRGLEIKYSSSIAKGAEFILQGAGKYTIMGGESALGNITRIINAVEKIPENLSTEEATIERYKSEIATLEQEAQAEFPQAKQLEELQAKLNEIDTQLGINVADIDMSEVIVDDGNADESADGETVHSSRDLSDNDDRWTTTEDTSNTTKPKLGIAKEKAINIANKAIDTVNKIPNVNLPNIESDNASVAEIVQIIKDNFDLPISTGKVTDRRATGIYKERAEAIRTRTANDLPTIFHELGHHLDKLYKLSSKGSIKELRNSVSQEFLEQYPPEQRNGEAVAEFLRTYLKNTEEAKRLCPDFYYDFVEALSKKHLKAVDEIANVANKYMASSFSERVRGSIVSGKAKEKTTLSEKAKKMHADWIDGFLPIKDVVDYVEETTGTSLAGGRNAYTLATNSLNARAIANFNTVHGFRDLHGNIIKGAKSFIECIADVKKQDLTTLDEYLVLKHSLEWIANENKEVTKKRVFADDTLEDVEAIERRIAEIEYNHPEMKNAAENLYEYQRNILKYIVMPAGGMTEDNYHSLNEKYPCYVPFYRAIDKNEKKVKATFANQTAPFKRAKGSGELIISPLESIINNTDKMLKFALRNQTMQVLTNYADTVDGFAKFIEKVPPDMLPHTTDITRLKENFEDALQQVVKTGKDYFAVSDLFDEIFGNSVTDFTPIANANKKIVTVLQNGQFSYYQVHDDALYDAIAEFTPKQLEGISALSHKLMQPMKMLITQANPIFGTTNALRDIGTAYKHSPINNPLEFAKRYGLAIKEVITNGDMYKQWQAMGGGHNSELSADLNQIKVTLRQVAQKDMGKARRIAYSMFLHPVATTAAFNDYIESIPRVMEFMRTIETGGDLQQAIYNADDITTNFKRSGSSERAKQANAAIMFNNAALQGLNKTYRTLTNKNAAERNKTLLKWALFALLAAAVQNLWNKLNDDEGYENLSSYKKNNFYNFSIGDGMFISIPKARETALLDSFTERTIEYVFGNDEAFYEFGGYVLEQIAPPMLPTTLNPIDMAHDFFGSTVLGSIADVGWNKNYMDVPIEGKYEQLLPSNERYNENTTALAYALGQTKIARKADLSPKKIDHLLSSYGIIGQANKALFPMNKERRDATIGLRNKFISDSNYSTDVLNKLYDNRDAAEIEWQYEDNIDNAIEYEQNAIITSYVSGMNKAIKALPEDKQREGRKYLLKTLNEWNYKTSGQQNMLNNLEGESITKDYIFEELPSSELSWTKDKKKYTYQMTPQEYNEYINIYLSEVEKARINIGDTSLESYARAKEKAKERMSNYKKNRLIPRYKSKATKN